MQSILSVEQRLEKNKMPLVSIIVPIYNKAKYLRTCIKSIVAWGGNECELILIDDGSTDESPEIVDRFKNDYPWIKVVHQMNCGVSAARNCALAIASGEYVTFVDADDEVVDGSLNKVLSYIKEGKDIDIFITSAVNEDQSAKTSIFEDMIFIGDDAKAALTFILTGGTEEKRIPRKATIFMSGCKEKFYRREFLSVENIYFDEELMRNEDVLFSCICYSKAKSIRFLPITTYIMKEDPTGITKGMHIEGTIDNHERFLDKFDSIFKERLNEQQLVIFYFHNSLVASYEMHRAIINRKINKERYHLLNKNWYGRETSRFMLANLKSEKLPPFKRIAFIFMKLHLYRLIGIMMDIHHRHR